MLCTVLELFDADQDQYGKTLLSHAIDSNNFEVVQLLVSAGARINQIRVRDRGRVSFVVFFDSCSVFGNHCGSVNDTTYC